MKETSPRFLKRLLSAVLIGPVALAFLVVHPATFLIVAIPAFLLAMYEWAGIVRAVPRQKIWIALLGVIYISTCFYAFLSLRLDNNEGWFIILILMMAVWMSDIGAYLVGRTVGGPKLAPTISPNKTWAGLGGAMIGAGLILPWWTFYYADRIPGEPDTFYFILIQIAFFAGGCLLGLVCQIGDLFISVFKRRAQLKDTGHIIPGHGGILDRIDSLMAASVFLYIVLNLFDY